MNLTIIAAIGRKRELGKDNDLCWRIREDLRFFHEQTLGKYIIMGEKTYYSLPRRLEGRRYLVLSPNLRQIDEGLVFSNLDEFLAFARQTDEEIMVCGGGMVYKLLLPFTNKMILTEIDDEDAGATVFFPEYDKNDWQIEREENFSQGEINYKRVVYKRNII